MAEFIMTGVIWALLGFLTILGAAAVVVGVHTLLFDKDWPFKLLGLLFAIQGVCALAMGITGGIEFAAVGL